MASSKEARSVKFNCPVCGREYDAYTQCAMYDPPRRPMRDGLEATVICSCINPKTEERTQFEITLRQQPVTVPGNLLNRIRRRQQASWEWSIDVEARDWL